MEEQPVEPTKAETSPTDAPSQDAQPAADPFDEASQVVVEDLQDEPSDAPDSADTSAPGPDPVAMVEAILFAADAALTAARIGQVAKLQGVKAVKDAIATLNEIYEQTGRSFRIESIAGGYQMLTQPEFHETLSRLYKARSETKLTGAALETLSIVAYKQPILRADVEAIRGVASGEVLRGLMERQMVKIVGRAEIVGRPMLYGTTKKFLETFGLASLEDLPKAQELRNLWNEPAKPAAPAPQAPANSTEAPTAPADAPAAPADAPANTDNPQTDDTTPPQSDQSAQDQDA